MEWLRSCYANQWFLFQSPEAEPVGGRYVFSPEGMPFYPAPHCLWSRNWISEDNPEQQGLGEDRTSKQTWYSGAGPFPFPFPQSFGDATCIGEGDPETQGLTLLPYTQGFQDRCYFYSIPPVFPAAFQPAIENRVDQLAIARILDTHYTNPAAAETMLQAWLGAGAVTSVVANSASLTPGTLLGWGVGWGVILISGTSNFQQLALQVADPVISSLYSSEYTTMQFWQNAAVAIEARIAASGVSAEGFLLVAGHSYGAAVACVLCAQRIGFGNASPKQLLTFGGPKPGDARLKNLLTFLRSLHFVNNGDPVPFIPPTSRDLPAIDVILATLGGIPALVVRSRIATFERPENQLLLFADGTIGNPFIQPADQTSFAEVMAQIVNDLATTGIFAHTMGEYVRRLAL